MNRVLKISIWSTFIIVMFSFLTTQLTNDFFVFWAYGRFVSNSELSGIAALTEIWELKGLLFKAYLYVEYAITACFSTLFDAYGQFVYKIVGLIPYLLILALSVYLFPKEYIKTNKHKRYIFLFFSILLIAVHFASHFQAEMWGVILLLLAFSIYIHDGLCYKILAAVVFSLTFYLKSPIPLMGGSLVISSIILKQQTIKKSLHDIIPFALTSAIILSITLFLIYCLYPQEINDILNASYYQHTLFHESNQIVTSSIALVYNGIKSLMYNPVIVVGLVAALIQSINWFKEYNNKDIVYLLLVWTFPLLYVLLSNCFFVYHYYLLAYSAILTIVIFLHNEICLKKYVIHIGIFLFVLYYLYVLSSISPTNIYEREQYVEYQKKMETNNGVYVGYKLGEGNILFLDDGTGAFYFANKSYLRYFYPLPLQRVSPNDPFVKMPTYLNTQKRALAYHGDYITLNKRWFLARGNNDRIYNKIHAEYELHDKIIYSSYSWTILKKESCIDTLFVYKRKLCY